MLFNLLLSVLCILKFVIVVIFWQNTLSNRILALWKLKSVNSLVNFKWTLVNL